MVSTWMAFGYVHAQKIENLMPTIFTQWLITAVMVMVTKLICTNPTAFPVWSDAYHSTPVTRQSQPDSVLLCQKPVIPMKNYCWRGRVQLDVYATAKGLYLRCPNRLHAFQAYQDTWFFQLCAHIQTPFCHIHGKSKLSYTDCCDFCPFKVIQFHSIGVCMCMLSR